MNTNKKPSKYTIKNLKEQVFEILYTKGYSKIFNDVDFNYYKKATRKAHNQAHSIASAFIEDNKNTRSDFADYVF